MVLAVPISILWHDRIGLPRLSFLLTQERPIDVHAFRLAVRDGMLGITAEVGEFDLGALRTEALLAWQTRG